MKYSICLSIFIYNPWLVHGWLKYESGLSNEPFSPDKNKPRSIISSAASDRGFTAIHVLTNKAETGE